MGIKWTVKIEKMFCPLPSVLITARPHSGSIVLLAYRISLFHVTQASPWSTEAKTLEKNHQIKAVTDVRRRKNKNKIRRFKHDTTLSYMCRTDRKRLTRLSFFAQVNSLNFWTVCEAWTWMSFKLNQSLYLLLWSNEWYYTQTSVTNKASQFCKAGRTGWRKSVLDINQWHNWFPFINYGKSCTWRLSTENIGPYIQAWTCSRVCVNLSIKLFHVFILYTFIHILIHLHLVNGIVTSIQRSINAPFWFSLAVPPASRLLSPCCLNTTTTVNTSAVTDTKSTKAITPSTNCLDKSFRIAGFAIVDISVSCTSFVTESSISSSISSLFPKASLPVADGVSCDSSLQTGCTLDEVAITACLQIT